MKRKTAPKYPYNVYVRTTESQRLVIENAAKAQGVPITEFVRTAAVKAAGGEV